MINVQTPSPIHSALPCLVLPLDLLFLWPPLALPAYRPGTAPARTTAGGSAGVRPGPIGPAATTRPSPAQQQRPGLGGAHRPSRTPPPVRAHPAGRVPVTGTSRCTVGTRGSARTHPHARRSVAGPAAHPGPVSPPGSACYAPTATTGSGCWYTSPVNCNSRYRTCPPPTPANSPPGSSTGSPAPGHADRAAARAVTSRDHHENRRPVARR